LREERRLRVFENRVLRRIFVPKRDRGNYIMKTLMIRTPHPVLFGDKIGKNYVGGSCSVYGEGRDVYRSLVGRSEGDRLGDPGADGRIILRWIFRRWDEGGMDSIELAQDRDRWRAVVTAVMNHLVP